MKMLHFITERPKRENPTEEQKNYISSNTQVTIFTEHIKNFIPDDIEMPIGSYLTLTCGLKIYVQALAKEIEEQIEIWNNEKKITDPLNNITCFWSKSDNETILRHVNSKEVSIFQNYENVRKEFNDTGIYKVKPL